jgi:hypothetical protein
MQRKAIVNETTAPDKRPDALTADEFDALLAAWQDAEAEWRWSQGHTDEAPPVSRRRSHVRRRSRL